MTDPAKPTQPDPTNERHDEKMPAETAEKALNKIEEVRRKLEPGG